MITVFKDYLRSHYPFGDADLERITEVASQRALRRNDHLLIEGEICRHKTFVAKGMLQIYGRRPDGSEHILQFSPENTWALDAESYDKKEPSRLNISAVEESEVLVWLKQDFDKLLMEIPQLKFFAEQLISRAIYSGRERLLSALSAPPEEKYNDFVREYPALVARLPLRMIAAYLGISLKTLTRIRHTLIPR